jgi:hypothetical protein
MNEDQVEVEEEEVEEKKTENEELIESVIDEWKKNKNMKIMEYFEVLLTVLNQSLNESEFSLKEENLFLLEDKPSQCTLFIKKSDSTKNLFD